jgi:hypothetical protein
MASSLPSSWPLFGSNVAGSVTAAELNAIVGSDCLCVVGPCCRSAAIWHHAALQCNQKLGHWICYTGLRSSI